MKNEEEEVERNYNRLIFEIDNHRFIYRRLINWYNNR